jgi:putative FmdB family regulatory protein
MPRYDFSCTSGHRQEFLLPEAGRDIPQRCPACSLPMRRLLSLFSIGKEHVQKQMYGYEQDKWALATGVKHRTAEDLSSWAESNGKAILAPGETVKKQDHLPGEREVEKALEEVHEKNHGLGEIR